MTRSGHRSRKDSSSDSSESTSKSRSRSPLRRRHRRSPSVANRLRNLSVNGRDQQPGLGDGEGNDYVRRDTILPQPNSTQPRVGLALFSYGNHNHKTTTTNHKPQTTKPNRIPLYLSSYTTKLDQIQYATLFQPN